MKIEILGTGCLKCKKTEKIVQKTVEEEGVNAEIIKIEDLDEIINRGVMMTPAIAIDGEVKIVGHVPTKDELSKLLKKSKNQ
jgi:small redox-active disulfide protein 2